MSSDQRAYQPLSTTRSLRTPKPRITIFALAGLAHLLPECSLDIASRRVFARQVPALDTIARATIAVHRAAADFRCVLPHQLCVMARRLGELGLLVVVLLLFVRPGVDGEGGGGVAFC